MTQGKRQRYSTSPRCFAVLSALLLLLLQAQAQDGWSGATPEKADAPIAGEADSSALFHRQLMLGSGAVLVVEESRDEPRSIGSYVVRLYSGANPEFPLDDFRQGLVLARDGFIEDVHGLDPDMLIVVTRSAGSGGYLSGTLLRAGAGLEVLGTLEGLPPDAELVQQLRLLAAQYRSAD